MIEHDDNVAVAVDFDNTISSGNSFALSSRPDARAIRWLKRIAAIKQCKLILWTTREDEPLEDAKRLLDEWGIEFSYFNEYPLREDCRKLNVDVYIDDKANDGRIRWFRTYMRIRKLVANRGVV